VRFYLHEESQTIDKLVSQDDVSEANAALQVLGTSYHQLGISVAREWGFPDQIIDSMKPIPTNDIPKINSNSNALQAISQFSNSLGASLRLPENKQNTRIKSLTSHYSSALKVDDKSVETIIDNCQTELKEFSRLIQFNLNESSFLGKAFSEQDRDQLRDTEKILHQDFDTADSVEILEEDVDAINQNADKALTDGIQDITNTLTGEYSINQILQMILETIFRALKGSRVLLCLRDKSTQTICARFGYGDNIEEVIGKFSIPLAYQADVFHIAFKNDQDIRIENTQDEKISRRIPEWYHRDIGARSFTIFPISINKAPIALIYIDSAQSKSISVTDTQLGLLKTLRNQAILAIKNLR